MGRLQTGDSGTHTAKGADATRARRKLAGTGTTAKVAPNSNAAKKQATYEKGAKIQRGLGNAAKTISHSMFGNDDGPKNKVAKKDPITGFGFMGGNMKFNEMDQVDAWKDFATGFGHNAKQMYREGNEFGNEHPFNPGKFATSLYGDVHDSYSKPGALSYDPGEGFDFDGGKMGEVVGSSAAVAPIGKAGNIFAKPYAKMIAEAMGFGGRAPTALPNQFMGLGKHPEPNPILVDDMHAAQPVY